MKKLAKEFMLKNKVFLDNSILITALLSSREASFYILTNLRNKFNFQINEYVLNEIFLRKLFKIINKEDAIILASALSSSDYLLTLDKDFLNNKVKNFAKNQGLLILTLKEFLSFHKK